METLKEMRLRCGYSRPQVANKLNVSDTAIAHWEAEDWTPSTKYHKTLARIYGVPLDEFRAMIDASKSRKKLAKLYGCSVEDLVAGQSLGKE